MDCAATERNQTASHGHRWPTGVVKSIERETGSPMSSLCTATISIDSSDCQKVTNAVSNYALLSRNAHTPLAADCTQLPLWCEERGFTKSRQIDEDTLLDFLSEPNETSDVNNDETANDSVPGSKCKELVIYDRPKLRLGFGRTVVTWPPPPHLKAERLQEMELALRKEKSSFTIFDKPPVPLESDAQHESEDVDTLYITYCEIQDKQTLQMPGKILPIQEFLIVSKPRNGADKNDDPHPVNKFLRGVLEWEKDRIPTAARPPENYLHLWRLRVKRNDPFEVDWHFQGLIPARTLDTVILKKGLMEGLVSDMHQFLDPTTKQWYKKHGIPMRRQYLFYGPPGTGKTSTIKALSCKFKRPCYFMSITDSKFSNQALQDALFSIPSKRVILVVEDVDSFFSKRQNKEANDNLSFSTFLNALDGIMSIDNMITIMTTNHIDKLDEALMRVGRVDKKIYFGHPDDAQIKELFKVFYDDVSQSLLDEFVRKLDASATEVRARTMSTLQEFFVACRSKTARECVEHVDTFFSVDVKK